MKIINKYKEEVSTILAMFFYTIFCMVIFAIVTSIFVGIPTFAIIKIIEAIKN